ncbi:MAG: hypothetical protein VB144_11315 [Clostridia bacterium]|nr:hypothetical protein [Clostridia bacterium]
MRRSIFWLAIAAMFTLIFPATTSAALPTITQLRGLFPRSGVEMDETVTHSESQSLYTLTARGMPVQIQAIVEDDAVKIVQGIFPRRFSAQPPKANDLMVAFLYACHPAFTSEDLNAWIYYSGYISWSGQLTGATSGDPWYGPTELADKWIAVAYTSDHGANAIGFRFAEEASRLTCGISPDKWNSSILERTSKPARVSAESLQRYPERYLGQAVIVNGTVDQKLNDAHYVVKTYDGRRIFVIMIFGMNPTRLLEDDAVTVAGISAGIIVSCTILGKSMELPAILAVVIK